MLALGYPSLRNNPVSCNWSWGAWEWMGPGGMREGGVHSPSPGLALVQGDPASCWASLCQLLGTFSGRPGHGFCLHSCMWHTALGGRHHPKSLQPLVSSALPLAAAEALAGHYLHHRRNSQTLGPTPGKCSHGARAFLRTGPHFSLGRCPVRPHFKRGGILVTYVSML